MEKLIYSSMSLGIVFVTEEPLVAIQSFLLLPVMLLVFLAGSALAGNNSGAAFSTWPGTNVSTCYADTGYVITCPSTGQPFYGQDGNCSGPARSYTSLGGGTMVQDNLTGLVWEVKMNSDGTVDYTNPHDADNTYTWCDTNSDTNGGDQGTCGTNNTEDFIDTLNGENFGGHNDWRLPTLKELVTLVDYSKYDPAIDLLFFSETVSSLYWSSTTCIHTIFQAWCVNFDYSFDSNVQKSSSYCVRAVRGGQ